MEVDLSVSMRVNIMLENAWIYGNEGNGMWNNLHNDRTVERSVMLSSFLSIYPDRSKSNSWKRYCNLSVNRPSDSITVIARDSYISIDSSVGPLSNYWKSYSVYISK